VGDVVRDLDNLNEMKTAINNKSFVFAARLGSGGQGLSGLRRRPATRAALMLNLRPVRLRWREACHYTVSKSQPMKWTTSAGMCRRSVKDARVV